MNRRHTLFSLAVATLTAATVLMGSPLQAQRRKLIMGTSPDYPPYEFINSKTGQIEGFEIDIAKYITEKLGYDLEIQGMDFNGLLPALQSRRVDFVMAGMTPTEERMKNADFSEIYFQAQNTIVARRGSNLKVPADLTGKRVGVQLGTIQEGEVKELAKEVQGMQIVSLNKISDLILELKARRIDAAIIEDTVAKGFVANNPDLEFNVIPTDGPSGSAIAFPKGSPLLADFNRVLAEMKESGKLEELAARWFSESIPQ
ncbi:MAG: transporter substrate-binding domain-containing protein [Thermostichales cyanobacterium GMQP_bins_62]